MVLLEASYVMDGGGGAEAINLMVGIEIVDLGNTIYIKISGVALGPIVRLPLLANLTNINKMRMGTHNKLVPISVNGFFINKSITFNESAHRGKCTLLLASYNEKSTESYTHLHGGQSASVLAKMCSFAILHFGVHSASIFCVA